MVKCIKLSEVWLSESSSLSSLHRFGSGGPSFPVAGPGGIPEFCNSEVRLPLDPWPCQVNRVPCIRFLRLPDKVPQTGWQK